MYGSKRKTDYMKRRMIAIVVTLFVMMNAEAQVIVKVRPITPVVIKPVCPSAHHVWIGGSWRWNKRQKNYVWANGYWARPRKHGAIWREGHWRAARGGWLYVPGHSVKIVWIPRHTVVGVLFLT